MLIGLLTHVMTGTALFFRPPPPTHQWNPEDALDYLISKRQQARVSDYSLNAVLAPKDVAFAKRTPNIDQLPNFPLHNVISNVIGEVPKTE